MTAHYKKMTSLDFLRMEESEFYRFISFANIPYQVGDYISWYGFDNSSMQLKYDSFIYKIEDKDFMGLINSPIIVYVVVFRR